MPAKKEQTAAAGAAEAQGLEYIYQTMDLSVPDHEVDIAGFKTAEALAESKANERIGAALACLSRRNIVTPRHKEVSDGVHGERGLRNLLHLASITPGRAGAALRRNGLALYLHWHRRSHPGCAVSAG